VYADVYYFPAFMNLLNLFCNISSHGLDASPSIKLL